MNYEFLNRCLALEPVINPADQKPLGVYPKAISNRVIETESYNPDSSIIRPELVKEIVRVQKHTGWYVGVSREGFIVRENKRENKSFQLLPEDQALFLAQANDLAIKTGVTIDDAALFLTRHMV